MDKPIGFLDDVFFRDGLYTRKLFFREKINLLTETGNGYWDSVNEVLIYNSEGEVRDTFMSFCVDSVTIHLKEIFLKSQSMDTLNQGKLDKRIGNWVEGLSRRLFDDSEYIDVRTALLKDLKRFHKKYLKEVINSSSELIDNPISFGLKGAYRNIRFEHSLKTLVDRLSDRGFFIDGDHAGDRFWALINDDDVTRHRSIKLNAYLNQFMFVWSSLSIFLKNASTSNLAKSQVFTNRLYPFDPLSVASLYNGKSSKKQGEIDSKDQIDVLLNQFKNVID